MLNEDYRDMLHALSDEKVKFLLVGAYVLAAHGYPQATMDIDTGNMLTSNWNFFYISPIGTISYRVAALDRKLGLQRLLEEKVRDPVIIHSIKIKEG